MVYDLHERSAATIKHLSRKFARTDTFFYICTWVEKGSNEDHNEIIPCSLKEELKFMLKGG